MQWSYSTAAPHANRLASSSLSAQSDAKHLTANTMENYWDSFPIQITVNSQFHHKFKQQQMLLQVVIQQSVTDPVSAHAAGVGHIIPSHFHPQTLQVPRTFKDPAIHDGPCIGARRRSRSLHTFTYPVLFSLASYSTHLSGPDSQNQPKREQSKHRILNRIRSSYHN